MATQATDTEVPSPADLLTNRTMKGLDETLKKSYDWIAVDTPPVGPVSEPLILAPLSDGVILVAGAEMVPRKAVLRTLERIHETGARILGIVLNRAQVDKHAYYYSHYYGHHYGRDYGTENRKRHGRRHGGNGKVEGSEAAGELKASEEKVASVQ